MTVAGIIGPEEGQISSTKDFDTMVKVEDVLTSNLSENSEVDGHDAGSGEINIFVHTDDPVAAFKEIKRILGSRDFWVDARVAYREIEKAQYTILWPQGLNYFKVT